MNRKQLLSTLLTIFLTLPLSAQSQSLPYQNPQLKAEQRADDLLKRLSLEEKVQLMMDVSPAIDRLQIPQFQWWNEALHGVGRNGYATVFPITMAMAASWDDVRERYDPQKLSYGYNTLPDGEEIFFIPNPALGLWISREKF